MHSTEFTPGVCVDLSNAGAAPGMLDPGQKKRVLRYPDSTLVFLPYDSSTAGGVEHGASSQKPTYPGSRSGQRIVVEIGGLAGGGTWAFIPRAHLEDGIYDEGHWPRVINICGVFVNCSQDQWDIYKLDPYYHCSVKKFPSYTTIYPSCIVTPPLPTGHPSPSKTNSYVGMQGARGQPLRRDVTMESITSEKEQDNLPSNQDKSSANDRNQHNDSLRTPPASPDKESKTTPKVPANASQAAPSTPRRPTNPNHGSGSTQKRKGFEAQLRSSDTEDNDGPRPKRRQPGTPDSPRTPTRAFKVNKGDLSASKRARQRKKQEQRKAEMEARKRQREEQLLQSLMEDVPHPPPTSRDGADSDVSMQGFSDSECGQNDSRARASPPPFMSEDERARLASIAESQRKLRALEADRPLWEAAARARQAKEAAARARQAKEAAEALAESHARRMRDEAACKRAESTRQQADTEAAWTNREEPESRANAWAAQARQARDRRSRMAKWTTGPWNLSRAFGRYQEIGTLFDTVRFSADEHPLTAEDVPWPTLTRPDAVQLSLIDWPSVEQFFQQLKGFLRQQEYMKVLETSHRRFHPDRWSSRGLFDAVLDPQERGLMEKAATTVSQALTPIWKEARQNIRNIV